MGRKNRRAASFVPLDLTPSDLDSPPITESQRQRRAERHRESNLDRARRQAEARVNKGIDWSTCIVPGCGRELTWHGTSSGPPTQQSVSRRDATLDLPICYDHAAVVWRQLVRWHANDDKFAEAVADVNERAATRRQREHEERKARNLAQVHGDIYFVRVGGLVKVGWTRDLWARVKSYGASAELLAYYPATRADETTLHRQLRPALAKGREWYEDGAVVALFIKEAFEKHGAKVRTFEDMWTQPKRIVAGKRHR